MQNLNLNKIQTESYNESYFFNAEIVVLCGIRRSGIYLHVQYGGGGIEGRGEGGGTRNLWALAIIYINTIGINMKVY